MSDRPERRTNVLSDADIDRIEKAFDKRVSTLFETIGYDTSTPEARTEIRKDHEFVRDARKAKVTIITGALGAIGSGIAWLIYMGAKAVGKAP